MGAVTWPPIGTVGVRRLLDGALVVLVVATFAQVGDPDLLLDGLWVVLAIGTFAIGFRQTVLRILFVMAVKVAYQWTSAASAGRAVEFELLELTEWPLVISISLVVALMADRLAATARRYNALYRQASEQLLTAHEVERTRLARDLHDGVGQTLTAALLTLDTAASVLDSEESSASADTSGTTVRYAIGRARSLVALGLDEARGVASELRPTRIVDIGLGAAFETLAKSSGAGVTLRFRPDVLPPGLLSPDRQIHVYRIVQEAISNAARHGQASHIWLSASVDTTSVRLQISDDGAGFLRPSVPTGLGLSGMEERATILGGEIDIDSHLGRGTKVTIVIPLQAPTEAGYVPEVVARRAGTWA